MSAYTTTTEAYEAYDEFLNETAPSGEGTVNVAGYDYEVARVLREVDPVAYRCGFNDWLDSEGVDIDSLEGSLYRH